MKNFKIIFSVAVVLCLIPAVCFAQDIKKPNVAGQFYPNDKNQLAAQIAQFLQAADVDVKDERIPMVIAPHAGYIYSGQTAAYTFKSVSQQNPQTVIVLAPSHFFRTDKISIWPRGAFETPLGKVSVDDQLAKQLQDVCNACVFEPQAFDKEHSLEVEIPFIQTIFPRARIVPVIVGQASLASLEQFASSLGSLVKDRTDVLIVISTDWSHYHDEVTARKIDQRGIDLVKRLNAQELLTAVQQGRAELCGLFPVMAAMFLAKQQGWTQIDILKRATSADATGDLNRVVGYAAMTFASDLSDDRAEPQEASSESSSGLSAADKRQLFDIAQTTVHAFIKDNIVYDVKASTEGLNRTQGIFVTLNKHGRLRGCIGRIVTDQPLYLSARDMAIASASQDSRFPMVRPEELSDIEVELSVLSLPQKVASADDIVLGRHGVIIENSGRLGVFLPQVANETGWSKEKFLSELCSQKAGLPADCWKDPSTRIKVFTADVFAEKDLQ